MTALQAYQNRLARMTDAELEAERRSHSPATTPCALWDAIQSERRLRRREGNA